MDAASSADIIWPATATGTDTFETSRKSWEDTDAVDASRTDDDHLSRSGLIDGQRGVSDPAIRSVQLTRCAGSR